MEPVRPNPTIQAGRPDAHFVLRHDRRIDPDPHQPRRTTTQLTTQLTTEVTTVNKHEGSPFASTKSTAPITGQ